MSLWLYAAAAAAFITLLIHFFLGGSHVVLPLLNANSLKEDVKFTHYLCWHLVTVSLFIMFVGFFYAAYYKSFEIALFMTSQSIFFALWNFIMIFQHQLSLTVYPQWVLFILIAGLGIIGILFV